MSEFTVRIATASDLAELTVLFDAYRQFYEQAPDLLRARTFLQERFDRQESLILIASSQEPQAVGFCQLYPSYCSVEAAPIFSLYDLFVSSEFRKCGVGRLLLIAAEEQAKLRGKVRMDLTTARTNRVAQSLYESLGWVRDDIFFAYCRHLSKNN
jgi:ribosomal protein S18 acetylase RimI-like enzyme